MDERKPHEIIQSLYEARIHWTDEAILMELETLPGLPDEDDGPWFGTYSYMWQQEQTQQDASLYLALAHHVAKRRLKHGVRLLLERVSYGDFGEIMRGMHHIFESVYRDQYSELADLCAELMQYPRRGTKLWALDQLARLRDRRAVPELLNAIYEPSELLFECTSMYLEWFYRDFPDERDEIERRLADYVKTQKRKLWLVEQTLADLREEVE